MVLQDIAYVELISDDRRSTADYFHERLAFTPFAYESDRDASRESVALRNGPVVLVISAPTSASGPLAEHLDRHGTGICDVAMTSSDLETDYAHAVAAGAEVLPSPPGVRTLAGFGPVRHTLLDVDAAGQPPPTRSWRPIEASPPALPGSIRIRALDHVAVCLPGGTLQDTANRYGDVFGLPRYSSEYIEVGKQAMDSAVVRSPSGGVTYTFIESDSSHEPGQIDEFLQRHGGAGVQHLAFLVDDIVGAVREGESRGLEFLASPDTYYDNLSDRVGQLAEKISDLRATGVLADRDEWGYLLQIFTRSPYPRRTLFFELIQRHAARGFGGSNIRALYEAVERERLRDGARVR